MTTPLEQQAREAAEQYRKDSIANGDHPVNAGAYAECFHDGFLAAAEPREKEIAELRAELNDRDTVPRSRYNACNQDWLDADKALTHLRDVAKREITERDAEIAALRARVAELEGMVPRWCDDAEHSRLLAFGWTCGPEAVWYRPPGRVEAEWHWLMVPPIPAPEGEG